MKNIFLWASLYVAIFNIASAGHNQITKNLLDTLKENAGKGIHFGHHNAEREGVHWNMHGVGDVYAVSGKHPVIVGHDFREIARYPNYFKNYYLQKMKEVHERGGVNTLSWHMGNPITGGSSKDTRMNLTMLLPGGRYHHLLRQKLELLSQFLNELRDEGGKKIPVIFRPWYEHNGSWFWWNAKNNPAAYKNLYRFTHDYLTSYQGHRQLIYAYSPDKFTTASEYFRAYPGDIYVDVLGLDYYAESLDKMKNQLAIIIQAAQRKGKLAALTETGSAGLENPTYWSKEVLLYLKSNSLKGLSYLMVWRNSHERIGHFFAPYPGYPYIQDFLSFFNDPIILHHLK